MKRRALIVEDNASFRLFLKEALKSDFDISEASTVHLGREALIQTAFDLVMLDIKLPDGSGTDLIEEASKKSPAGKVVVLTAYGDIPLAIDSIRRGASDFFQKPVDYDDLMQRVKRLFPDDRQAEERAARLITGISEKASEIRKKVTAAAFSDVNVCITGKSGTGKEHTARAIHEISSRRSEKFAVIDCSTLPSGLAESELFGAVKGAYSGAEKNRTGKVSSAGSGTLYFDNIDDCDAETQGRIVRFAETKKYYPLGSSSEQRADVKLIFSSKTDLEERVKKGLFREDLYFRINVFPIDLPSIYERREDIECIAEDILEEECRKYKTQRVFSESALRRIKEYDWPGNIREIKNIVSLYSISGDEKVFDRIDPDSSPGGTLKERADSVRKNYEKNEIADALKASKWNKTSAAKMLKISYRNLLDKIKEYGIEESE